MTLQEYLKKTLTTQYALAAQMGVEQSTIHKWCNGKTIPRPAPLARLSEHTGGLVRYEDFVRAKQQAADEAQ